MSWPRAIIWPSGHPLPGGDMAEDAFIVKKEMALTHADFFRIIPRALGSDNFDPSPTGVILSDGDKRLEITVGEERTRQIALMVIPACDVRLAFSGYLEEERKAALFLFDRMFQKGGG